MERLEGSFFSFDEAEIFYQVWRPEGPTRGYLLITHGMGEHSEAYHQFASDLIQDQWTVYAWDLRGHGRSEGKRGYIRDFSDYSKDLVAFTEEFKSQNPSPKNCFLLGHSMGGLILFHSLLNHSIEGFNAACFSSPLFGISIPVPKIKAKAAEFMADWLPKLTLHNEIVYRDLHRDPDRIKEYEADPLRHDKVSSGLFIGIQKAMEECANRASEIHMPVLFQLAGDDRIVSTPAAENIFEDIGSQDKKIYIYPDNLHEIFNDLDRGEVIKNLKSFLQEHEGTT